MRLRVPSALLVGPATISSLSLLQASLYLYKMA